jgi:hypothetical protein
MMLVNSSLIVLGVCSLIPTVYINLAGTNISVSLHHNPAQNGEKEDKLQFFLLPLNILLFMTPRPSKRFSCFQLHGGVMLLLLCRLFLFQKPENKKVKYTTHCRVYLKTNMNRKT